MLPFLVGFFCFHCFAVNPNIATFKRSASLAKRHPFCFCVFVSGNKFSFIASVWS